MALRARELFYFVRIGNYASRPLRQIESDFKRLGTVSNATTKKLAALDERERKAFEKRARLMQRRSAMMPGGRQFIDLQERQARKMATLEKTRTTAMTRRQAAQNRLNALDRVSNDLNNQRLAQDQARIRNERRIRRFTRRGRAVPQELMLRRQEITGRLRSIRARTGERVADVVAVEKALRRQEAELKRLQATESEYAAKFGRDQAKMAAESQALTGQIKEQHRIIRGTRAERGIAQEAQMAQQLERRGQALSAFAHGARIAQFASGALTAAFAFAAHSAIQFQTSVQLAGTQLGNTSRQMVTAGKNIGTGILAQMKQFPASAQDMSKASYDIYSSLQFAGNQAQQTAQGMAVLKAANMASVAGMVSVEDSTKAVVIMLNTFAKANKDGTVNVSQLGNMLNTVAAAVRYGRMNWQEFTQALVQTAPAAKASGQSFTEMSGALAFLTTRIPSVRNAAVAYARLVEVLGRSTKGLHKQGIEVRDATGKFRPLSKIITEIAQKNPKLAAGRKEITDYFKQITKGAGAGTMGTIQARKAFVFLVQQHSRYIRTLNLIRKAHGQFAESYAVMRKTAGVRWDIAMNRLHALALEVGVTVIPIFEQLLRPVQRLIKWFNNLDQGTKKSITKWIAWGAIITLIASTVGVLVGSIGSLMLTLSGLGGAGAIFAAIGAAAPELVIAAAAIAALVIALKAWPKGTRVVLGGFSREAILTLKRSFETLAFSIRHIVTLLKWVGARLKQLSNVGPIKWIIHVSFKIAEGTAKRLMDFLNRIPGGGKAGKALSALIKYTGPGQVLYGGLEFGRYLMRGGRPAKQYGQYGDITGEQYQGLKKRLGGKYDITPQGFDPEGYRVRVGRQQTFAMRARGAQIARQRLLRTQGTPAQRAARTQALHNAEIQKYIRLLVAANKAVAKHPKSYEAQLKLLRLRDKIAAKFSSNEASAIESAAAAYENADKKKIKSAKKLAQEQKKALQQMQQDNKTAIDNMVSKYQELLQANKEAFGDITQQPLVQNMMTAGVVPKFRDYMGDITSQIKKFSNWRKELTRGTKLLPKKLLGDIQAAGIEAEPFLAGLLKLTPKQRAEYVKAWKRGQALIKKASDQDFQRQLGTWRGRGRKAALAFLNGFNDEQGAITKRMQALFTQWMHTHGVPTRPRRPRHTPPHTPRRPRDTKTATSHTTHHHNDNRITVHANKQDLSTTLRKAQLAQRQKARRLHNHPR